MLWLPALPTYSASICPVPFTDVCLGSINCWLFVLENCCSSSEEDKAETQLGPRSSRASTNHFMIKWISYLLAKEAGEACRAIILADGPDLTQLLLLFELRSFSPVVITYCLKLLWSSSQDVAVKVVILKNKPRHKRKKLKWIRQWWRLSSFHWAFIVILTSIHVLHFPLLSAEEKAIAFPFWTF